MIKLSTYSFKKIKDLYAEAKRKTIENANSVQIQEFKYWNGKSIALLQVLNLIDSDINLTGE